MSIVLICLRHKELTFYCIVSWKNIYNNQFRLTCWATVCMSAIPQNWMVFEASMSRNWLYHKHKNPTANELELQKKVSVELRHLRFASISRVLLWRRHRFNVKYQMCTSTPAFNCYGFTLMVDIEINLQFKILIMGDFWCTFPGMDVLLSWGDWQFV